MKFHLSPALIVTAITGFIIILPGCNKQDETTVTDIDGNVYHTVVIGNQVWMEENLRTTHYRNGDTIPDVADSTDWDELFSGAWCDINNQYTNAAVFGHLYNWYALSDPRGLCPSGWRIPTDDDWTVMAEFLGGEQVSGGKLKESDTLYWHSPNTGATNETGFSGLPGGSRQQNGPFWYFGYYGLWWTSTAENSEFAFYRSLSFDNTAMFRNHFRKNCGLAVRCIKGNL
jgi:uncharacterized protein (TIGR02145 family)